jgi:hypothetical protein
VDLRARLSARRPPTCVKRDTCPDERRVVLMCGTLRHAPSCDESEGVCFLLKVNADCGLGGGEENRNERGAF